MLSIFRKFVGFKILEYFLQHPTEETYLKELAKILKISPRSVKIYCDQFEKDGIITRKIKGNLHLFTTNNEDFRVREFKRAYIANLLAEHQIDTIAENAPSVALYGSHASGTYDEKSDIDLLIIGEEKQIQREQIIHIMHSIGKEIQLTIIPMIKWEKMKKTKDIFAQNILNNHMHIKGVEL